MPTSSPSSSIRRPPSLRLKRSAGASAVWRGVLLGALSALGWRVLVALGWMTPAENRLLDSFFQARSTRFAHPALVLVTVDDATVERAKSFPLPRIWHARVVDALSRAGAKTIAFDILFADPSASRQDDLALQQACARAGNVVQPMVFWVRSTRGFEAASSFSARQAALAPRFGVRESKQNPALCEQGLKVTPPLAPLMHSAVALGHLNALPEKDGVQRRIPPLIRYQDGVYPSLPLAAAAHFLDLELSQVSASGRQVLVGEGSAAKHLEMDTEGEVGINWAGGYRALPTYSYLDILEGRVPPEVLRGRLVLIGSTLAGSYDQRATPIGVIQPGLEVQANALDDILLNRPLHPAPPWLPDVALLLLPCALGGVLAALGRRSSLGLGVLALAAVLLASMAAFSYDHVWPVATPLCAMTTTLALVAASNYRRAWESSWRAQVAVETLARGGSLLSSATQFSTSSRNEAVAVPESARAELARVATETLALALGSPLVLWARDDEIAVLAATPNAWLLASQPLESSTSDSLRALASQAERLPNALIEALDSRTSRPQRASHLPGELEPQIQQQVLVAACALEEMAARSGQTARLGRQVLVAPIRRDASTSASAHSGADAEIMIAFAPRHASWGKAEESLARAVVEQALLALTNLQFTHALAGRVEAADRDLREAYEVVFEQSTKLSAALEGIDDALLITDRDGCLIYANAASRPVLRQAAPLIGQNVPQVLEEQGLPELARGFGQLPSLSTDDRVRAETTLSVREGESEVDATVILASQMVPLLGLEGQPLGAMLIVSDATAQRQIDKMKTDFVAFVAHELRTPLTTILGYASLLQQMGANMDEARRAQMSNVIIQHCQRLNRMISEMLDTSSLEAGGTLSLRMDPLDLTGLAERLVNEQKQAHQSDHGLSIGIEAPVRPLIAEADADRIEQVLTNLLSNAIKYSPQGGHVRVQVLATDDGREAILRVSDEGMGMTPEQVNRLFEKFYRTPDAQKKGIKGTGLGLFLVRQLVRAHVGRIEVESEIGVGTTFSVFLPRKHQQREREWKLDDREPS